MSKEADSYTVRSLKEQLSEKEFRIGELETRVRDLNNEAKELDEKLNAANRNARVLEEENSNYHVRIKSLEKGEDSSTFSAKQKEAMMLIQENEKIRGELLNAKKIADDLSRQMQHSEVRAEKDVRNVSEECERMRMERSREAKELENTRRQYAELQRAVEEERETSRASKDLWGQERERYLQKIDELIASSKRPDGASVARAPRGKAVAANEPLEQTLLKGEVADLEQKLEEMRERHWSKEKEWMAAERALRREMSAIRSGTAASGQRDKEVFRALQDQVESLQKEISELRSDRRPTRQVLPVHIDTDSTVVSIAALEAACTPRTSPAAPHTERRLASQYDAAIIENEKLRDEIDQLRTKVLQLQCVAEEREVRCKELQVDLATAKKNASEAAPVSAYRVGGASGSSRYGDAADNDDTSSVAGRSSRAIMDLRRKNRELENEIANLKAAQEQKDTIGGIRVSEAQKQIDELLAENEKLQSKIRSGTYGQSGGELEDDLDDVMRLTKDKRESVEEVMRLLETSWDAEDDAKRLLRRTKYQGAAMANNTAAKDDEIRRLQKIIDDLENKLRGLQGDRDDLDKLRAENDALRKRIGDLERANGDNLEDLKRRLDALQKENDRLRNKLAGAANQPATPRGAARSPRPSPRRRTPEPSAMSQLSVRSTDEQKRNAIPEGAHLAVTVVELADVLRNGRPITEPGFIIIKLKSIKEKYKTSVRELSSVIRFDETFVFYLAQPDQDVITLHVFYKPKKGNHEYHIGDACFSMATLYRGVPRQRIAPVVQSPGTKDGRRSAQVEVHLQTDDFGKMIEPTEEEVEDEKVRFNQLVSKLEGSAPEKLHAADVYMASSEM